MSKKRSTNSTSRSTSGIKFISAAEGIEEYKLTTNSLRILYLKRPNTGTITTNITYLVGARDEARGETGVAHMLEHMLFKPTRFDLKRGITAGGAMDFERSTGCILNANTWKDRTTYFFNYPAKYFETALQIEAERMTDTILTNKALAPEQGNVLSEHDMYNGDPVYALSVQMVATAFHSHPYGHETIGHREDIEDYTAEILERFYRNYYRPDNAVMMVIGDVDREPALKAVKKAFGQIKNPTTPIPRFSIREPKQEGLRRVTVERPSNTNIVTLGFKHAPLPDKRWFTTILMKEVLSGGPESILHKLLVDTGKASDVDAFVEPTAEENIAIFNIILAPGQSHTAIEAEALQEIRSLKTKDIKSLVRKVKAKAITEELFTKTRSLGIAQELTEYVAAGHWQTCTEMPKILNSITAKDIISCIQQSFAENQMTIGYFKGKV